MSGEQARPEHFVTADIPGIGGTLRSVPEDFVVVERLVRRPIRSGAYVWFAIEKRDISTPELIRRLGAALGEKTSDLNPAGFKDANAVTTQWISAPARFAPRVAKLDASSLKDARVLSLELDHAPLDSSFIAANQFRITIRDLDSIDESLARASAVLDVIARRGIPNFYGVQRFGLRLESAAVGAALLSGDGERALDLILGAPSEREHDPRARVFREAYVAGDFAAAIAACPGALRLEHRLLEALARGRQTLDVAREIPAQQQRFYLSAWQSLLFNRVLAARLSRFDTIVEGDLVLDARGKLWDSRSLPARANSSEFTPTGPLFGDRVALADLEPGRIERAVLLAARIRELSELRPKSRLPFHGERRALGVPVANALLSKGDDGRSLVIAFDLPSGAFATTLLTEVMKTEAPRVDTPPPFQVPVVVSA